MTRRLGVLCLTMMMGLGGVSAAFAQAPASPWALAASAGLALTSGNTDTSTVNAAYDAAYDPHTRNVVKSDGLLIRGKTQGTQSTNRLSLGARDEFRLTSRMIVYGETQYLKDQFKDIDYLVDPTGGLGVKIVDTDTTKLGVDAGLGGVWEKNPVGTVKSSGAVTSHERFVAKLTPAASLTQGFSALWKTQDFKDSLYTANVGISASMSARTQLKVEFLETFKNKPPVVTVKKSDIAVLMAIVFKM